MKKLFTLVAAACLALTMGAQVQQYNVAEAIAANLAEDTEIEVRGVVTKIEFKGKNFAKYGSANIYVADATGAEGAFEFYNCYSLAADTFKTSDPAFDATSTAWVQFNSISDANGATVHVGDTVIAHGNYTLYNNTVYELKQACYLTSIIEPAATPVVPADKYYVVGSMTGWNVNEAYELVAANEGEYKGEFTFAANDEFKVVKNDKEEWYPGGMNNNYVITEAGDYKITFNPAGNVDGWYEGFFNVVKKAEAQVLTVAEAYELGQALADNVETEEVVTVEGFAVNVADYSVTFGNQEFYLADDATSTSKDFMAYRATPTKNDVAYPVLAGDKVQVIGKIKKYVKNAETPAQVEIMNPTVVFITEVAGDRTIASSFEEITVARALELGAALAADGKTADTYDIIGYVTQIDDNSFNTSYNNMTFWIADAPGTAATNADGAFEVYRGKPDQELEVGDKVKVRSQIQNYKGNTIESLSGATVTFLEKGGEVVEDADVIFTSEEFNGLGHMWTTAEAYGDTVTVTKDGVTFTCDVAGGDKFGVRCYKNSNVTITSAEQQIGKIVFEFATVSGTYYNGGLDEEIVVNGMSWNAEGLTSQARMNKVKIYFGQVEEPEEPVYPENPEGVITCAAAAELAAAAADPTADNKNVEVQEVRVRGFVTFAYDAKDGKQSVWIADDKKASAGVVQGYYLEVEENIVKGDYVELAGKLVKYFKAEDNIILEVTNGTMTKIYPETIENVVLTEQAQKVVVDGVIYIVRDGKMFNLQGAQVR